MTGEDDIPTDDFDSAASRVLTPVVGDATPADVVETASSVAFAVAAALFLLGQLPSGAILAGCVALWVLSAVGTEQTERDSSFIRDTGWRKETVHDRASVDDDSDCVLHDGHAEQVHDCNADMESGHEVRAYDVFEVNGVELFRRPKSTNKYCRVHYTTEYPDESPWDYDDVEDVAREAEEDEQSEQTSERTRETPDFTEWIDDPAVRYEAKREDQTVNNYVPGVTYEELYDLDEETR